MAIRIKTLAATDLRPASTITKRNFATAISVAGTSGKVVGFWQSVFVRLPASGFTNNTVYHLWGSDSAGTGAFNGGNDNAISMGGDNSGQTTLRLKPRAFAQSGGNNAFSASTRNFTGLSALTSNGIDVYKLVYGVQNTGTDASPVWQGWLARVQVGGGVSSEVEAAALGAAYIAGASGTLLAQIFNSRPSSGAGRSPVGLAFENFAHVNGDFPWDTANNRPHHDALLALANGTGAPATLHSYSSLIAAQNAGTLGYANLRSAAKADLAFYWTLSGLSTGLANSGNGGTNALSQSNWNSLTDGLEDVASFTPAHWTPNPTITEPAIKFLGGRGARSVTITGTYQAGTTALQRRWVQAGTSTVVSGFDWAAVGTFGGGAWTITDTLPVGHFDLQVRDTNDNSRAATMASFMVGTVMLVHAQSGSQLTFASNGNIAADVNGQNMLGLAVASGAAGMVIRLANAYGGVPATYAQPLLAQVPLIGGAVPAVGQGTVTCLNEWNANNPGHPLLIVNMALEGSAMANWAANASLTVHRSPSTIGHASWFYMGTAGAVANASSGNNSGIAETLAALIGRWIDVHYMMWTPGMASDEATRTAYVAAINARFSANTGAAWWLGIPPWRGHRSGTDGSATVAKRGEHVSFVAERGALGVLGPYWPDTVMDGNPQPATTGDNGSLHPAYHSNATAGTAGSPVSEQNQVGVSRLGRSIGRSLAWVYDRSIKAHGPRVVAAWFRDATRTVIEIELGRVVRTLNGAAINNQFWVSTDNGSNFAKTGFTVALDATGTRAVLTSTGGAWPASNVRVDYARAWPFAPIDGDLDETLTERKLDGLLYDDQTHRGGTNLATPAGNPLASANGSGVAVAARGSAKLLATERWTGTRNVTVRMIAADGVTVLREKTFAINAS